MNTAQCLAAILSMLADTPEHEAPTGIIYSALMSRGVSHSDYMRLQVILCSSGGCTLESGPKLRLTAKGLKIAEHINGALRAAQAA